MEEESGWDKFLFNLVYVLAAAVAAYHSFVVFLSSDPWYIAAPAALVVDGLTAYSVNMLGRWRNSQRAAGWWGIGLFVFISSSAQIIARFQGSGEVIPVILRYISLGLVPLSSTGAVLALGVIKFMGTRKKDQAPVVVAALPEPVKLEEPKSLEDERKPLAILPAVAGLVKRKPGRPAKPKSVAYAKDVASDPKLQSGS